VAAKHPYQRIADTLRERIATGAYRPGDQLPSESRLRHEFGVSPMTLRRALALLVDEGLVSSEQGRGTFVRPLDLGVATFRLHQLTRQWLDDSVEVQLLAASTAKASPRVAEVLQVPEGKRTVYLRRLLLRRGHPIVYHHEHVVYDAHRPLVESQLQITSIEGLLQSSGGQGLLGGQLRVFAVNLDDKAAELLHEQPGAAALCLEHVFFEVGDTPVSWGWFLCRADQFSLETQLGPGMSTDAIGGPWTS
jgi:GntR family transcriptional regulator